MFKKIFFLVLIMSKQVYATNEPLNSTLESKYKKDSIEIRNNHVIESIQSTNGIDEEKKTRGTFGSTERHIYYKKIGYRPMNSIKVPYKINLDKSCCLVSSSTLCLTKDASMNISSP